MNRAGGMLVGKLNLIIQLKKAFLSVPDGIFKSFKASWWALAASPQQWIAKSKEAGERGAGSKGEDLDKAFTPPQFKRPQRVGKSTPAPCPLPLRLFGKDPSLKIIECETLKASLHRTCITYCYFSGSDNSIR